MVIFAPIWWNVEKGNPILVVDDEEDIRNLLLYQLRREGLPVRAVGTGLEAIEAAKKYLPSLIILDLMLPGISGTEVCRRLRGDPATAEIPIIMLSARGEEIDRVVGFEVGADDYVTKPFSARELLLRVRAVMRRAPAVEERPGILERGRVRMEEASHRVWVDDEEVALTATEFKLLLTLARKPGRVYGRGQLLQDVWDMPPDLQTRTVDTHVKRLREKLLGGAAHVETVRGVGYRYNVSPRLPAEGEQRAIDEGAEERADRDGENPGP